MSPSSPTSPAIPEPTPADKFSFGLWTVGYPGRDPFGEPTRPPMDPVHALERLAGLGAYGVNFHDDDLIPFGSSDAEREAIIGRFTKGLAETGVVVTTATTNLFTHPVFKDGAFTANVRDVRRFAIRKVMRNIDLAAELGARVYVAWGGREGAESGASKDVAAALDRYQEAFNLLGEYIVDQGYDLRIAIEPKPNEPRGDILLPTVGHALAFIETLDRPELVGVNPEIGHEEMAGLNAAAGYAQAMWQGKLFHIDLNGQHGPRYDQDLRFGAGNVRGAFWVVDTLLAGGYDGPVHFDFKPPRTEDEEGVWVSARACMTNYLVLREKARAFRADPEVQAALEAARLPELARPTLDAGEGWQQLAEWPLPDVEALAVRGAGLELLDQLALEHLYGVRG
ncbi:xylose isomerase [Nocardioides pantholopis]|uniref:xylose isomerase n=1 Tax=Nocardioides pantholopis TaxID=2483798 RepID=UPI000FD855C9|nr:xylose isomerase [Nocardioides pantholopis]